MTTPGAKSNRPQLVEDLDAMLSSRMLKPAKVKFGGRMWTIRRDFTPDQVVRFWMLADSRQDQEAYALLVGAKDAADFYAIVAALPTSLATPPLLRLYQLAGLLKRPEDNEPTDDSAATNEGESSAS